MNSIPETYPNGTKTRYVSILNANLRSWTDSYPICSLQLNLFRNEVREILRKNGAPSRIAATFDAGIKFEILSVLNDDLAISILRVAGFSTGETVAFAYCLIFSQNKVLSSGAKRALKLKLPDVRTTQNVAEIPEEIRLAIFSLIQADEVRPLIYWV